MHEQTMVLKMFVQRMGSLAYCVVLLCNMYGAYAGFFKFKVCAISQYNLRDMVFETAHWYQDHAPEMVPVLATTGIFLCLMAFLWIASLTGFIKEKNQIESNLFLKVLAMIDITIGTNVAWIMFVLLQLSMDGKIGVKGHENYTGIGVLLYGTNCSLVLCIFGLRIIKAFKNTKHEMSKLFKIWLFLLITILIIIVIIATVAFFANNATLRTAAGGCIAMFAAINGALLLIILIRKLNKIIEEFLIQFGSVSGETMIALNIQVSVGLQQQALEQQSGSKERQTGGISGVYDRYDQDKDDVNEDVVGLDKNMITLNNIIADMIKFTILVGFAITSTCIVAVSVPVVTFVDVLPRVVVNLLATIDVFVNGVCLILQFKMARPYYKVLCKFCINKCQQRQTIQINNSIKSLQRVANVELRVLPGGSIGIETLENEEKNDKVNSNNQTGNDSTIKKQKENNGSGKDPAIKIMQSVEMQLA